MRKYSANFERDYDFYLTNKNKFTFCGTITPKHKAIFDPNGKSAKEVFYSIDSSGKNHPTKEPGLLDELLLCKAGVNFQIKQWAEGRVDGTLPLYELTGDGQVLNWLEKDGEVIAVSGGNIREEFNLPEWVIKAVENQKEKILKNG